MSIGISFNSPLTLSPQRRVYLPLKSLKPGIDFFLAVKVLDAIFFQYKAVFLKKSFMYFWLCWVLQRAGASLHRGAWLLIAPASLAVEHGLSGARASVGAAPRLLSTGSVVVVHGLSCFTACGIFLDQVSNLCLLHWQVDSLPLSHEESPRLFCLH